MRELLLVLAVVAVGMGYFGRPREPEPYPTPPTPERPTPIATARPAPDPAPRKIVHRPRANPLLPVATLSGVAPWMTARQVDQVLGPPDRVTDNDVQRKFYGEIIVVFEKDGLVWSVGGRGAAEARLGDGRVFLRIGESQSEALRKLEPYKEITLSRPDTLRSYDTPGGDFSVHLDGAKVTDLSLMRGDYPPP